MKVVSIYRFDPIRLQEARDPELDAKMGALIAEMQASGVLVDTGGVIPNGMISHVRYNGNGALNITDGPFAETKEVVGGFAVFNVSSKEEVLGLTERFLSLVGHGVVELIEVSGPPQ